MPGQTASVGVPKAAKIWERTEEGMIMFGARNNSWLQDPIGGGLNGFKVRCDGYSRDRGVGFYFSYANKKRPRHWTSGCEPERLTSF